MLIHKIRKLLVMPKDEILFRIAERRIEKRERQAHASGKDRLSDDEFIREQCGLSSQTDAAQTLFDDFWSKKRMRFFTELYEKKSRQSFIKKHHDDKAWLEEADRICEDKLTLLGAEVDLATDGGWQRDPIEGCEWPRVFYTQVSKAKPSTTVDIKYVWEMNRHQYLIVLGKAYWMTGDEKYAEKACSIIESWISDNPYHEGVNWTSSLELAVRSISWIWTYFYCKGSKHATPEFHHILLRSIYEHGHHMAQHLSYYSSPYNHLIGEAAGLYLVGSLFPQLKEGPKWERLGWEILEKNMGKQFFDDGMCVEQATFYHHFTLGFYLQAVRLRKANQQPVSENVVVTLEKALEVSMCLTKPDGTLPAIGDIDNARSLYFNTTHTWDFRGFLSLGAALFNRPDFKHQGSGFSEELLWLVDDTSLTAFDTLQESPPNGTSHALSRSGYYVMRTAWEKDAHYLCFDCGEIAEGLHEDEVPSAAHGHADALSFELSAYGKAILVEGGFHTYFGELLWHRHFRQEAAHNTIQIGHHRQAVYCGRLTWKSVRNPKLNDWRSKDKTASVSGSIRYDKETSHRREIVFADGAFWILSDRIETTVNGSTARAYFHFDSHVSLDIDREKRQVRATNGDTGLLLQYFDDFKLDAQKGGEGPESGWQAAGYGYKIPAWVLSFEIPLRQNITLFPMLLMPWKENRLSYRFDSEALNKTEKGLFSSSFSFGQNDYALSVPQDGRPELSENGVKVLG